MPSMYLRPVGDESKYSDAADYEEQPFDPPEGFEWVLGEPPEEATIYLEQTVAQRIDALFMVQPPAVRAQFYGKKAEVKLALEMSPPDVPAAILIMESITGLPAELEAVKDQMLDILNDA